MIKRILLSFCFAFVTYGAFAYDFSAIAPTGQTLYYNVIDEDAQVVGGSSLFWSLVIPQSVSFGGRTLSVTSIGDSAFYNCTGLTSITIPSTITNIGLSAFENCTGLTTVNYNATNCSASHTEQTHSSDYDWDYTEIIVGNNVFTGCNNISTLNIGSSVSHIPSYIFSGLSITSITIPSNVNSIGEMAFRNCSSLHNVQFNANCEAAQIRQLGIHIISDGYQIVRVFDGCDSISSVSFGANVSNIPAFIFEGCPIRSVTIPENVESIRMGAFNNCNNLETIYFNARNCTYAGEYLGSTGVYSFISAFGGCNNISKVVIGDSVTTIPSNFLVGATCNIDTLTIPNSITYIGDAAFAGLNFSVINYNATNCTYAGHYGINYDNWYDMECDDGITTNSFFGCNISKLNIGNNITNIPNYLFYGCRGFDTITIPESISSIGSYAFGNCMDLTTINYNAVNCTNMSEAFSSAPNYGSGILDDFPNIQTIIIGESVENISSFGGYQWSSTPVSLHFNAINCLHAGWVNYIEDDYWYGERLEISSVFDGINIQSVVIGENVSIIPNAIFYGSGIDSISIPSSVNSIGDYAFMLCGLQRITSHRYSAPTLGTGVFDSVDSTIPVIIPCGSYSSYDSEWNYFSNFQSDSTYYSFSFSSANSSMGTVSILETPNCAHPNATINAIANSGYTFNHWSDHDASNPRTLTISSDTNILAFFVEDTSSHDTVFIRDTIFIYDTTYVNNYVHDTTYITQYVYDTTYINTFVHDTLIAYVNHYVHDTTFINNYIHDTSYIYRTQYDTQFVYNTVHDTAWLTAYIHDTAFINNYIHDTVWLTQTMWDYIHDTVIEHVHHYIHDTTFINNYIHDTTYLTRYVDNYIHDTVMQYVNQYIHDTTFINNYIHDTVINYVNNYIHDTTFINNYLFDTVWMTNYIYDTVYINNTVHDTAYITQYVHDTTFVNNYVHDTLIAYVNQYVHDTTFITNYIHDTSYIYRTQYDTLFVYNTVHDTAWLTAYVHDTAFVNNYIHDTLWLTQIVWEYIHDTVIEHVHHYIHDTTIVNNYIHDTVMQYVNQYIHDTTFINNYIHDTVFNYINNYIHDTTFITNYVHDTTFYPVYIHDTTFVNNYIHDTLFRTRYVYDTTYINNYIHDTVLVYVTAGDDTTFINNYVHDTLYIYRTLYDTTFVYTHVHDTTFLTQYIHDTAFVNHYIHDTLYLTQWMYEYVHDTIIRTVTEYVHDTTFVNNYIHDTTFLDRYIYEYLHDTIMQYINHYIHDTTYINNYIHDTAYLTQYVHDTAFIYQYIHDTIVSYVNHYIHDTTFVNNYIYDTIYLYRYIYDTIYIHDTIYLGGEGIEDIALLNARIYQRNGMIVVEGAEGNPVYLYDVVGRLLATRRETAQEVLLDVPASGAYLVKIGDAPARRIVVRR